MIFVIESRIDGTVDNTTFKNKMFWKIHVWILRTFQVIGTISNTRKNLENESTFQVLRAVLIFRNKYHE